MSYAESRRIIDVDSHVIELDDFLLNAARTDERAFIPSMSEQSELPVPEEALTRARQHLKRRRQDPDVMARFEAALLDKGFVRRVELAAQARGAHTRLAQPL